MCRRPFSTISTVGDGKVRPNADAGYQACMNAKTGPIGEGSVGAGAGATVGKLGGGRPMKGGIGTSSIRLANGLVVGAIVAVNCIGDVIDPKTGKIVAGARSADGKAFLNILDFFRSGRGFFVSALRTLPLALSPRTQVSIRPR